GADAAHAGPALLGCAAGRAHAGAGRARHHQRAAGTAAARGRGAHRRRRGAAVRGRRPAGAAAGPGMRGPVWREYWALTKPRVVALIVFTAVIGMFLAQVDPRMPGGFA